MAKKIKAEVGHMLFAVSIALGFQVVQIGINQGLNIIAQSI